MLCVKGCAMGLGKYDMKTRSIVESGIRENRIESEAGLTKKTGKRASKTALIWHAVALSLLVIASSVACTFPTVAEASPRELAEDTKEIVQGITDDEKDIFSILAESFEKVQQLQSTVNETGDPAIMFNEVLDQLEVVTETFEEIAGQRDKIKKELTDKVTSLPKIRGRAESEIEVLRARRVEYEQELATETDRTLDGQRAREVAITQAIQYVDRQIETWEQFTETQISIEDQVDTVGLRIETFIDILEGHAIVYREAVNLLKLQRDIRDALSLVTEGIPQIESLSQQMQDSWATLDSLVEELLTYTAPSPE
jgi:hypothetical protein